MSTITTASKQWASRPDDERFLTLSDLKQAVTRRRSESWTAVPRLDNLRMVPGPEEIGVEVYDPTAGVRRIITPTHWGFTQLAQYAGAPSGYLRKLPTELAAINLQWGVEHRPLKSEALMLAQSNGEHSLRALTSISYGRIWDHQVVEAVEKVNQDDLWVVPAASYAAVNLSPKRATTLYASDRDVFIFLVDPSRPIEVGSETLFRGFYVWNSEVGSAVFGICTFLYRYVCDNRIIWGATDVRELRIRHTGGAPDRFAYEGARYLQRYAEESTSRIVSAVQQARRFRIPKANEKDGVSLWLQSRGFPRSIAVAAVNSAVAEEGQARSLWDIVNGITAYARTVPHTNDRVDLETRAGALMALAA